jgi:hypothetical protein
MAVEWYALNKTPPNKEEHHRVLIFTEGVDFNGEQVFDVKTEWLEESFYEDPSDQPEVCRYATHWTVHPCTVMIQKGFL